MNEAQFVDIKKAIENNRLLNDFAKINYSEDCFHLYYKHGFSAIPELMEFCKLCKLKFSILVHPELIWFLFRIDESTEQAEGFGSRDLPSKIEPIKPAERNIVSTIAMEKSDKREDFILLFDRLGLKINAPVKRSILGFIKLDDGPESNCLPKSLHLSIDFDERTFTAEIWIDIFRNYILTGQAFETIEDIEKMIKGNRILDHLIEFKTL